MSKTVRLRFEVAIDVEDDWTKSVLGPNGRRDVVLSFMRSATSQGVMAATVPYMSRNGINVVGMSVSDARFEEAADAPSVDPPEPVSDDGIDIDEVIDALMDAASAEGFLEQREALAEG